MKRMTNFLAETLEELKRHGKSMKDVRAIQRKDYRIAESDFLRLADFEYDAGYGGAVIAVDLVILGSDWWLERGEYDGSEWWAFKTRPVSLDKRVDKPSLLDRPEQEEE